MALENRIVVSPMAQYKAVDGCPTDWHFVHYAERAKGGAGLVYTEMTCVSPEGRITPGCPGLYAPEHEAAWKRLVDFVHAETQAKICCQIGHSGPQGLDPARLGGGRMRRCRRATGRCCRPRRCPGRRPTRCRRRWTAPTWTACATSSSPQREMADALRLRHDRTARGARLPDFLASSRPNRTSGRTTTAAAWKTACATRWRCSRRCARPGPTEKPISVRISATDWVGDDGVTPDEAVGDRADVRGRPGPTSSTSRPARPRPRRSPSMAGCSRRPFSRPHPQRGGPGDDGRRQHHRAGSREFDPAGGPRRSRLPRASAPGRPLLDAARGDRAWGTPRTAWPLPYLPGRDQARRLAERAQEVIRA